MESRALSDADKERKYEKILSTTLKMFKRERRLHTAAEICREVKIAKGTLYLYFSTKDEIYMELLVRNFRRWHEGLREYVLDQSPDTSTFIVHMCRSLADFTDFVDLRALATVILEENLPPESVRDSRQKNRQETRRTCQLMVRSFPQWTEEFCEISLRRFYTYGIAHWKECFPPAAVVAALPDEYGDMERQRAEFFSEILVMNRLIWGLRP
ncbi:MAG: TetR/AcrR family transcriptional regulator [Pseudobdellovibrionaceae bacterium]|nr:TetR/AcrR family transcriptional regulator [Pseudobdellovibrionaceae bacterium]